MSSIEEGMAGMPGLPEQTSWPSDHAEQYTHFCKGGWWVGVSFPNPVFPSDHAEQKYTYFALIAWWQGANQRGLVGEGVFS